MSLYIISKFVKTASDYESLAQSKISYGDYKGAIEDYNEAIKISPKEGKLYYLRSVAKNHLDDEIGAKNDIEKSKKLGYTNGLANYKKSLLDYRESKK